MRIVPYEPIRDIAQDNFMKHQTPTVRLFLTRMKAAFFQLSEEEQRVAQSFEDYGKPE